jgi:hypothetical protein
MKIFYQVWIAGLLVLGGCAVQKPKAVVPTAPPLVEPVPGHPGYHYGPEHWECDAANNCELVRNWLSDKDNKPVLSPLGCWLAKARITWIFGDKPSMCEQRPSN